MANLRDRARYLMLRSPVARAFKAATVRKRWREVEARRRLASELPSDEAITDLCTRFGRDGMVFLDELIDIDLVAELADAAMIKLARGDSALAEAPPGVSRKDFWRRLLDDELVEGRLRADSVFARFALQPRLLSFVARSMGGLPQLDYVLLTHSIPTDAPLAQSQLWHRDHDDTRTIKVFVYLTPVESEGDGPFTLIPGPCSDRMGHTLRSHMSDEAVFRRLEKTSVKTLQAPRLACFAVETSRCLHMGSRVSPGHRRLLYTATYTSFPNLLGRDPRGFILAGDESALNKAVLAPGSLA